MSNKFSRFWKNEVPQKDKKLLKIALYSYLLFFFISSFNHDSKVRGLSIFILIVLVAIFGIKYYKKNKTKTS